MTLFYNTVKMYRSDAIFGDTTIYAVAIFENWWKKRIIEKWDKRMGFFRALFSDGYGM